MICSGRPMISRQEIISQVSEADILGYYLNITSIPSLIHSPLRQDTKASFALYSPDGTSVNYKDFSTGDGGCCMSLLMKLWHCNRSQAYNKIQLDLLSMNNKVNCKKGSYIPRTVKMQSKVDLQCKTREWKDYDLEYWNSFGIPLELLKWADVHPISHKIVIKDGKTKTIGAEKYSYTFVERKEGRITHKFYSPFNNKGYKWMNNHDKSVLGLWTKMPKKGDAVCICSSVKDALCMIANMHIPCICTQGEGYPISDTAKQELLRRFRYVYVCFDNDEAGIKDAKKLTEATSFINIEIPQFEGGKDVSDYYKCFGKEAFVKLFSHLFIESKFDKANECPF